MQILLENSDINSGKQSLGRFHKNSTWTGFGKLDTIWIGGSVYEGDGGHVKFYTQKTQG